MNGNIKDRRTLCLLSNSDLAPWSSQEMYEYAWEQGTRPLDEGRLKPGARRFPGHQVLDRTAELGEGGCCA
ncbi:MAG: hypothetical protein A4E29_00491 [Methanomassiliicoccales archaeon PtaB.Bin134]|jgi:hypothetical protein|nr:MAG: hypothetical protein A4E29_00491 [Methanomassiliicoccales archaeon PtaB.Bin134]